MPMINMSDLNGQNVKPGDSVTFTVNAINGDKVELSYENPQVEESKEMSMDDMNDPMKVKEMDSMSSDQMRKKLPKKELY